MVLEFSMKNWSLMIMPSVLSLPFSKCRQTSTRRVRYSTSLEWSSQRPIKSSKLSAISRTRSWLILSHLRERVTHLLKLVFFMKNKMISCRPLGSTKQLSLEIKTTSRSSNISLGALSANPKFKRPSITSRTSKSSTQVSPTPCTSKVDVWWLLMITRELLSFSRRQQERIQVKQLTGLRWQSFTIRMVTTVTHLRILSKPHLWTLSRTKCGTIWVFCMRNASSQRKPWLLTKKYKTSAQEKKTHWRE